MYFALTDLIQTDRGSEFEAEYRLNVFKYAEKHRYSRPYRKNEQSYIESFNRSLRKECLGWGKYKQRDISDLNQELTDYLIWYHDKRPHMGLNMQTPNKFIQQLPDF